MSPTFQISTEAGPLVLPAGIDHQQAFFALAKDWGRKEFEALKEQERIDKERAAFCSSDELSRRHNISVTRIQGLTRRGILPGTRAKGANVYSYPVGPCDDIINALRRPDGGIKGQRRDADPNKGRRTKKAA